VAVAQSEALAAKSARLLEERKADDIVVLQVEPLTSIADYFVIATGRNQRQLRAMAAQLREGMGRLGITPLGTEGTAEAGWILVDLGDVIVHLFDPARRLLYDLEVLWGDAPVLNWAEVCISDEAGRQDAQ
jgi:ribosome-associated protein